MKPYSPSAVALAGIVYASGLAAQPQSPRPEFEAASIRVNVDGTPYVFNGMKSLGTFSSENQTLKNLIQEAYGVPSGRRNWLPFSTAAGMGMPIFGGPQWITPTGTTSQQNGMPRPQTGTSRRNSSRRRSPKWS